ncbi:MAG: CDGSH iron-sulfur domain-containing protein [Legionella sp.]|nr:MAG: CDGSH iron-sulfur domain-containing protein [Legionella sp.]
MDDRAEYQHLLPITLEVKKGVTYFWCSCGQSKNPPLCDRGECCNEKAIAFVAEANEDVTLCNCKQTKNPPFCDGSHAKLLLEIMKKKLK